MLSVIISVYNVRPYIKECVSSVRQLSTPCEIIIVHDAQKDDSFIGDEEYLKDERITILNRENAGLGIARNQGLDVAKGEYVHFLDGDDKIYADKMEQLYREGREHGADIICGDYDDSDTPKKCRGPKGETILSGTEYLGKYCDSMISGVWRFMYKRDFLLANDLKFERVKYFEDVIYLPIALSKAGCVYFDNIPFYYYRFTENTLSNVFNRKRSLDIFTCFKILNKQSELMPPSASIALRKVINNLLLGTIYYSRKYKAFDDEIRLISKECISQMHPDSKRIQLYKSIFNMNWRYFLLINDAYCAIRISLGQIKNIIKGFI